MTKWCGCKPCIHNFKLANLLLVEYILFVCVCVCVCVCECVFAGKRGPCSDILHSDSGHATKRGRPRIGEIVLMVANSTCIHMCAKHNINITCTRYVHGSSIKFHSTNCGPPSEVRKVHDSPYNVRHTESSFSCYLCVFFKVHDLHQIPVCVCVCVCVCLWYDVNHETMAMVFEWERGRKKRNL